MEVSTDTRTLCSDTINFWSEYRCSIDRTGKPRFGKGCQAMPNVTRYGSPTTKCNRSKRFLVNYTTYDFRPDRGTINSGSHKFAMVRPSEDGDGSDMHPYWYYGSLGFTMPLSPRHTPLSIISICATYGVSLGPLARGGAQVSL